MGFLSGIAKYILFLFNLLILIAAIALIAVGVLYHNKNPGLDLMSVSSFTIAIGVIIALVSFFGCCGAVKESRCLLTTYAFIMITIFIIQVVLVVLAFLAIKNSNFELDHEVEKYLTDLYEKMSSKYPVKYYLNINNTELDAIKELQRQFECCGINGNYTLVLINPPDLLIDSCCESKYDGQCTIANAYKSDCVVKLREFIESYAKIIGGIAIGVAVVEIVAAIFAFWVRNNIGRNAYA